MRKLLLWAAVISLPVLAGQTLAQNQGAPPNAGKGHMEEHGNMPMMGGMHGMMMNCPMMQQTASLQERVRVLEEKAGIKPQKSEAQ